MTIRNIGSGTAQSFSTEEIESLHRNESTSSVLNEARRRTGDKGGEVAVRGNGDVGLEQQLAANREVDEIEVAAALVDAASVIGTTGVGGAAVGAVTELGTLTILAGGAAIAAEVLIGISPLFASHYALASMQKTKTDTRDAATRDVMRGAMLLSLELPSGYVASAMPRDVGTGNRSPAKKIGDQLQGTPLGATLQLHCDQGTRAAEDFLSTRGRTKEQFFAGAPKLAERYANDAAFKAGFDALLWAKQSAPEDYKVMLENLRARDARYAAVNVRVSA